MKRDHRIPFSTLKPENWRNLALMAVAAFYIGFFAMTVKQGGFPKAYGIDSIAFWSVGRIADEKGYSEIYDVENLKASQINVLNSLDQQQSTQNSSFAPIPVPFLPLFVVPLQLFSRLDPKLSFWIWTVINLLVLLAYLIFLSRRLQKKVHSKVPNTPLTIMMLLSFPVFANFINGQVNVFLLVCTGEFLRNVMEDHPFTAGLWLGGLLLKPQVLILIVPVLLILRYWKIFAGFFASSAVILLTSLALSGWNGMKALVGLWTKYSAGMATNAPENMINWRMVGVNLNYLFDTQWGWLIAGFGMAATLLGVILLVKRMPPYGSPGWIVAILGVFCATLAVTWHAHYHMAMVIIPLLLFALAQQWVSRKLVFYWVVVTPLAMFLMMIVSLVGQQTAGVDLLQFEGYVFGSTGFIMNLVLFISIIRNRNRLSLPVSDNSSTQ